jgi:isoleucyl-tRNA synthetase
VVPHGEPDPARRRPDRDGGGHQDAVRDALLPLWNTYYFLALYANAENMEGRVRTDSNTSRPYIPGEDERAGDGRRVADGHVRSRGRVCDGARVPGGPNELVRETSRIRFWAGEQDAIDTLHTVLEVTCRVVAPLMPLTSEAIWRGLTGGRSVHLTDWPLVDELPNDTTLVHGIDRVRQVCSSTLALRTSNKLRVRLPLAKLTIAASMRSADAVRGPHQG